MIARRRLLLVPALAVAFALTACGSTVQQGSVAAGSVGSDGLSGVAGGTTGGSEAGLSPVTATGPGATADGAAPGALSSGSQAGGSTAAGAVGTTEGDPVGGDKPGRGVTATTVTIGVPVATDQNAFANSMGISYSSSVTVQSAVKAAVDRVNRSGGILGRKLQVYYHGFSVASYVSNPAQTFNEICTDFREDHPVFAVLFTIPALELRECLAKMGTPLIGGAGQAIFPESSWTAHGANYFYAPHAITVERLAKLFIASLMKRDFHQKWDTTVGGPGGVAPVKLGVIHPNTQDANALYAAYAKELAKHGLKFAVEVTYEANLQAGLAATQGAVLRFKAEGITHVYGASAFFLQDAENQAYRPRYAYLPGLGYLGAQNSPPAQLKGALTVGWIPTVDVDAGQDPGDTPGASSCRALMRSAGVSGAARADQLTMYSICDLVSVLRDAVTAGGAPTVAALRRGYESIGSRFPTALTFGAVMAPGRHYGADSVRDMAYDSACSCLKYT
jgi:ABC-type branched-subunit amino acid transport system substrate-binding protein